MHHLLFFGVLPDEKVTRVARGDLGLKRSATARPFRADPSKSPISG